MHLFIIGNGFDIAHNLPTEYKRFREYLIETFPGSDDYDELVPESRFGNHGEEVFDIDEVAGYVSRIIDGCCGEDWSNLEHYLGDAIFDCFLEALEYIDMNASDRETMRAITHNEVLSTEIRKAFLKVKSLFCDWIRNGLACIKYEGIQKENIATVLSEGNKFLSFNYTMTLEEVYGISDVCHVHGKVGDFDADIFFGHGDDEEYPESLASFGADSTFNVLKRELRKNTYGAIDNHKKIFQFSE